MSEEQRKRFDDVQVNIDNVQEQITEAFSRQENNLNIQLSVLKEASSELAIDAAEIQGRLGRMEKGDDKLQTTMNNIIKSGTAIQDQLTEVERLLKSAFPGDGNVYDDRLGLARDALRKGYDLLAYETFEKTEAKLVSKLSVISMDSKLTAGRWRTPRTKGGDPLRYQ